MREVGTALALWKLVHRQGKTAAAMQTALRGVTAFSIAGMVFTADRLFKCSVESMPDEAFPRDCGGLRPGKLRFEKHHNPGFAFGTLKEEPRLVAAVPAATAAAAAVQLLALCTGKKGRLRRLGLALILGGGLSNLYDRLRFGYVIDFLNIRFGFLKKVVLNIGDLAIACGALLLAVSGLFGEGRAD